MKENMWRMYIEMFCYIFSTRNNIGPSEVRFGLWSQQLQWNIFELYLFAVTHSKQNDITFFQIKNQFNSMRFMRWSPLLSDVWMFIMALRVKKLKDSFTYQAAFNDAWFDKGLYKEVLLLT